MAGTRVTQEALRQLQAVGAELVQVEVPGLARLIDLTTLPIQNHDVHPVLKRYLEEYQSGVTVDKLIAKASPEIQQDFHDLLLGGKFSVDDRASKLACDVRLPKLKETYREYLLRPVLQQLCFQQQ